MRFWAIFRFEIGYQFSRAWPWLIVAVLMALVFLFMRDGSFGEALYTEFFINSPFMVAMATVFGSLLWLLTAAFVAGEAAARDVATGMHPLAYTVPVTKAEYLGGKLLAAFLLNAFILLTVQATIMLAIYLPGVHPDSMGPFRPAAFLTAYFFIALPNAFAATAIQFAFALRSGRPIAAYIGSLLLFFTAFFIASLILFKKGLGTLLDPIGVRFIWDELSHLWTTVEKSHRLLELTGPLLQNRLVWVGTGLAVLTLSYLRFRLAHRTTTVNWWSRFARRKKAYSHVRDQDLPSNIRNLLSSVGGYGFAFHARQVKSIAWTSFLSIAKSWAGLAMLIIIPLMAIPVVIDQMYAISIPLVPTTARVIRELTGPLSADMSRWMIIPGLIIYFAGELIWRERDNGLGEITDAMPGSDWAPLLGKFLGIVLMIVVFTVMLTSAGMLAQVMMDYNDFEPGLYLKIMFGLQLPEYVLFAVLAILIHVAMDQKYAGHIVAIIAYAFIAAIATMLGIEHNMLIYGAGPTWSYTEMRGFEPSIGPWLWFKLYWAAWALMLLVVARLLWVRGKESNLSVRLQLMQRRFAGHTMWVAGTATALILLLGGFIFYNTNILNRYSNSAETDERRAEYERRYGRYENIPQPQLSGAKLHVEIYPERRTVQVRGTYRLLNSSGVLIDSIHVTTSGGAREITFDRKASLAINDDEHGYRIYVLGTPLKPGDTVQLDFEAKVEPRGFTNRGLNPSLAASGTYFTNEGWFPSIGFQRMRGLVNPAQRREHGLDPRALLAALSEAHEGETTSLDEGIELEAVIGTADSQVAVAPGELRRTWSENGRSYFHYSTSAPIGSQWAFFSANYEIYEKEWASSKGSREPVVVRIFHHPNHTAHVERMMRGVLAALEYYGDQFGPYPYRHLTVVEHPAGPGTGMHAEASIISHGQGYADWIPKNENTLDFPYAVMGHEMGHQWTLPYAFVEGLPFLSEGIAWYYGIMLVKATRGPEQTRRLMTFMRQPYPHQPIRRGEPLLRALDPYLSYKRGPLAMYALSEYAGSDRVNSAIKRLIEKSDAGAQPVTTLDLYRELKAVTPDTLQTLLHDFFEVNTLWQFETNEATSVKTDYGWRVTLDVNATKIVYDSAGVVTEMPMDEWVSIGIFAEHGAGHDELSKPLYLKNHRIRSGDQTIVVTVNGMDKPVLAGIDPHHLLDWEEKEDDDNIEDVRDVD